MLDDDQASADDEASDGEEEIIRPHLRSWIRHKIANMYARQYEAVKGWPQVRITGRSHEM
jgi:hypothetical protein